MHRNKMWIGFLILITFITLWFTGKASNELINYMLLSDSSPIEVTQWSIDQVKTAKYLPRIVYSFKHNGQVISGNSLLNKSYPNMWACEKALDNLKTETLYIWYNPAKPENGVLNKVFPFKSVLSAVSTIGLIIYFFYLGKYVSKKTNKE